MNEDRSPPTDDELVHRAADAGDLTESERARLDRLLADDAEQAAKAERVRRLCAALRSTPAAPPAPANFSGQVLERWAASAPASGRLRRLAWLAAPLAAGLLLTVLVVQNRNRTPAPESAVVSEYDGSDAATADAAPAVPSADASLGDGKAGFERSAGFRARDRSDERLSTEQRKSVGNTQGRPSAKGGQAPSEAETPTTAAEVERQTWKGEWPSQLEEDQVADSSSEPTALQRLARELEQLSRSFQQEADAPEVRQQAMKVTPAGPALQADEDADESEPALSREQARGVWLARLSELEQVAPGAPSAGGGFARSRRAVAPRDLELVVTCSRTAEQVWAELDAWQAARGRTGEGESAPAFRPEQQAERLRERAATEAGGRSQPGARRLESPGSDPEDRASRELILDRGAVVQLLAHLAGSDPTARWSARWLQPDVDRGPMAGEAPSRTSQGRPGTGRGGSARGEEVRVRLIVRSE